MAYEWALILPTAHQRNGFGKLVVAACILSTLGGLRIVGQTMFSPDPAFYDVLHFGFGLVCAYLITMGTRSLRFSPRKACMMTLAGVFITAALIEMLQPAWGQEADAWDTAVAVSGGIAFVVWVHRKHAERRWVRMAMLLVCGTSVIVGCARPLLAAWHAWYQRMSYPVLASFESPIELWNWEARGCQLVRSRGMSRHGRYSLRVQVQDATPYPGVTLVAPKRPEPDVRFLAFSVWCPPTDARSLAISLRVDDGLGLAYADRFQSVYALTPGWNSFVLDLSSELRTPTGRVLNKENICAITFFVEQGPPSMFFYLDDIRWEP